MLYTLNRVFKLVIIIALGLLAIIASALSSSPWSDGFAIAASILITLGISLPIALHFQLKQASDDFRILDLAHIVGIKAIFRSRDNDAAEFRKAVDVAVDKSDSVQLLGVAFRNIFANDQSYSPKVSAMLDNPEVELQVLILSPDCEAARCRNVIEDGETCITNIEYTLRTGFPTTFAVRLGAIAKKHGKLIEGYANLKSEAERDLKADEIIKLCKLKIKTYDIHPIVFLMGFNHSVFTEQYHFGRPDGIRKGTCIGKKIPIIEYKSNSACAKFMRAHFDYQWRHAEDQTRSIAKAEIEKFLDIESHHNFERATA